MIIKTNLILFIYLTVVACTQNKNLEKHQFDNSEPPSVSNCRVIIQSFEQIISKARVRDSQDMRITDFSYLRVNRFLSSFRNEVFDEKFVHWVELLRQKGVAGWLVELKNLPTQYKDELEQLAINFFSENKTIESKLTFCSETLSRYDLGNDIKRKQLRQNAIVPSEYNLWQQVLGIYPLLAIPMRIGIYQWHQETLEIFKRSSSSSSISDKLILFTPKDRVKYFSLQNVTKIIKVSSNNALQIPILTDTQQQILFNTFAPSFEINVNSENDRIGTPEWVDDENIIINTKTPVVYKHISHTRFFDNTLLQLNYIIWFPSRPKTGRFDLLGGHLDGIIWRVTLDTKGEPLMYDSIHMCGCYHLFFPTQKLSLKQYKKIISLVMKI